MKGEAAYVETPVSARSARRTGREKGRVGDDQALLGPFSLTDIDAVPPRQDSAIRSYSADRGWGAPGVYLGFG